MKIEQYWMVGQEGSSSCVRCDTRESAEQLAQAKAVTYPGVTFVVLAVYAAYTAKSVVEQVQIVR